MILVWPVKVFLWRSGTSLWVEIIFYVETSFANKGILDFVSRTRRSERIALNIAS